MSFLFASVWLRGSYYATLTTTSVADIDRLDSVFPGVLGATHPPVGATGGRNLGI